MQAGLGHHNARTESCLAGGPQGAILSVRQDLCSNSRGTGLAADTPLQSAAGFRRGPGSTDRARRAKKAQHSRDLPAFLTRKLHVEVATFAHAAPRCSIQFTEPAEQIQ